MNGARSEVQKLNWFFHLLLGVSTRHLLFSSDTASRPACKNVVGMSDYNLRSPVRLNATITCVDKLHLPAPAIYSGNIFVKV